MVYDFHKCKSLSKSHNTMIKVKYAYKPFIDDQNHEENIDWSTSIQAKICVFLFPFGKKRCLVGNIFVLFLCHLWCGTSIDSIRIGKWQLHEFEVGALH